MRSALLLIVLLLAGLGAWYGLQRSSSDPGSVGPDGRPVASRSGSASAGLADDARGGGARDPAAPAESRSGADGAARGPAGPAATPVPEPRDPNLAYPDIAPDHEFETKYAEADAEQRRAARDAIYAVLEADNAIEEKTARMTPEEYGNLKREVEWLDVHSDG